MATTVLSIDKDTGSVPSYGIPFSNTGFEFALPADTDVAVTVPTDANLALFQFGVGTNVWTDKAVITIPVSSTPAASTKELNAAMRQLIDPDTGLKITTLHFRSLIASEVKVTFFR